MMNRSPKASAAFSSPLRWEPLRNWIISTRIPLPTARRAIPKAAVVLPLPSPVLIRISPRRESVIFSRQ
jgi:hypothetical protein